MTALSVNVNKVALIRNSRGANYPNLLEWANTCIQHRAQGITVHPRPDGRHILYTDVYELKKQLTVELNVEGYPGEDFMQLVCEVQPAQVTLVPDKPGALTSDSGWDTLKYQKQLRNVVDTLHSANIRTSLFVGTNTEEIKAAADTGTDRVELYTGPYALNYSSDSEKAMAPFLKAAEVAKSVGLDLNAGHDLNLHNLTYFKEHLPDLLEVSIGHALTVDALHLGIEDTIKRYLNCLS